MTTERPDELAVGCACTRTATCDRHARAVPPERLETRARQCSAIDETGRQCPTYTLRERCLKHRRQQRSEP
jgi:hypothetical protein